MVVSYERQTVINMSIKVANFSHPQHNMMTQTFNISIESCFPSYQFQ